MIGSCFKGCLLVYFIENVYFFLKIEVQKKDLGCELFLLYLIVVYVEVIYWRFFCFGSQVSQVMILSRIQSRVRCYRVGGLVDFYELFRLYSCRVCGIIQDYCILCSGCFRCIVFKQDVFFCRLYGDVVSFINGVLVRMLTSRFFTIRFLKVSCGDIRWVCFRNYFLKC